MKNTRLHSSALVILCALLSGIATVHAKGPRVVARGSCSGGIKTKLTASPENGRIELEYELDNAAPNQAWRIVLRQNGRVILRTTQRTNGVGDLEARKLTTNANGNDAIRATASRAGGAGACNLSLVVPF